VHPDPVIAAVAQHGGDAPLSWFQAIVVASIPTGVIGLALEHPLRVLFAKPTAATLTPFGLYCLGFGLAMTIYTTV
jgi:undecaprenyl pyrophosphate phosphatase UppP